MTRSDGLSLVNSRGRTGGSLTVITGSGSGSRGMLYLQGALRAPLDGRFRCAVRELLRRGDRLIVLDLAGVARIDAAGVGELVGAFNMAVAGRAVLRIVHSTPWVREILQRVGLFEILTTGRAPYSVAV